MHGRGRYRSRGHGVIEARGGHSSWLPTDRGGSDRTRGKGLGDGCDERYSICGNGVRESGVTNFSSPLLVDGKPLPKSELRSPTVT
jgi:hypothetical protein